MVDQKTKSNVFAKYPFYEKLSVRTREQMHLEGRLISLDKDAPYFSEGDSCSTIAMVGSGSVAVYKVGENGRTIVLYRVTSGQLCILSTSCVLSSRQLPAFARAESAVTAVLFPSPVFRQWVDEDRALRLYVFDILATRMNNVVSLVEEMAFGSIERRLAGLLAAKFQNGDRPLISIDTTHDNLASELGSAREVVSRELKKFEIKGAISLSRGHINIVNRPLLDSLSEMIK